jgi:hypothetical protein
MTDPIDDLALRRELESLPRGIEPPEDLWPTVRARLGTRKRPWWTTPQLRIAALLLLFIGAAGLLVRHNAASGRWRLASLAGERIEPRVFAAGEALETAPASRALLEVGTIGHVEVEGATSLRLIESRPTTHRLALRGGTIHARISAPPRLFVVETPAGVAWDLGCAYTLSVDSTGHTVLNVTLGWVAFEHGSRESLVPAGFTVVNRPGSDAGVPWADDATPELRRAVAAFDSGRAAEVPAILAAARRHDAITLWHLLSRTSGAERELVLRRMESLVPLPRGVARDRLLELDRKAMRLYWQELPGALEIIPSWTRTLWVLWLRVFG